MMIRREGESEKIEQIRSDAAALIPEIIASRQDKISEFERFHEEDKASFEFRCERHGDFLAVFMTRGIEEKMKGIYYERPNKIVCALNVGRSRMASFTIGKPAGLTGCVRFGRTWDGSNKEVIPIYQNSNYPRYEMVVADPTPGQNATHGSVSYYSHDYLSGVIVPDCPAGAQDDTIYLLGCGITIHAPFSFGQMVYDAILTACEERQK